ncbi:AcrR family transcriptional regulator [Nocardiopsis arvandica]|uniref:AcrR family transcriptional regulator n=1 Tax=Nocardiopsis sinuspersici TaxID=501010 RepID=A0A7Z0BN01_9ACTN|nr:TetR/AcrR family transcriptional regulator [Nocardiopsis sinuspersici]NYH55830.1 AcrR family transcriptional regulator [Nocardiopsis sinuspersici]
MARTVDEVAHARRREEFLDAAQRLIGTKGYEEMSVRDVLDEASASRGAFYHYFGSKQDLLWALIDRTGETLLEMLRSAVEESGTDALARLRGYFKALAEVKLSQRALRSPTLRTWQSDGNVLTRQKVRTDIIERHTPLLAAIVRDGVAQGLFTAPHPEHTGRLLITLIQDLNEELTRLFLAFEAGEAGADDVRHTVEAYSSAVQSVLGLPEGSVVIVEPSALLAWFDAASKRNGA